MKRYLGWVADWISDFAAAHPMRKRSKIEKALIRRLTREAEQRKRAAGDDDTKPGHKPPRMPR